MASVRLLLGGLLLSVWGGFRRRIYTSMVGLVLEGLAIVVIGVAPGNGFQLALGAIFAAGVMNPLINGPLLAILQGAVSPDMQGRVFTLVSSLSSAMMPLSLAVAGPVADAIGVRAWYIAGGAIFSLIGAVTFFVPTIADIEQDQNRHSILAEEALPAITEAVAAEG
jgi:DHA3 family macrolide efflux protein-like MFS transporter